MEKLLRRPSLLHAVHQRRVACFVRRQPLLRRVVQILAAARIDTNST